MGVVDERWRVIICGDRNWEVRWSIARQILRLAQDRGGPDRLTIVHGDCPTGADRIAREICEAAGINHEPHPALWEVYGKAAGPIRNGQMVAAGAQAVYAFKQRFDYTLKKGGTEDCVGQARWVGIPCAVWSECNGWTRVP